MRCRILGHVGPLLDRRQKSWPRFRLAGRAGESSAGISAGAVAVDGAGIDAGEAGSTIS